MTFFVHGPPLDYRMPHTKAQQGGGGGYICISSVDGATLGLLKVRTDERFSRVQSIFHEHRGASHAPRRDLDELQTAGCCSQNNERKRNEFVRRFLV